MHALRTVSPPEAASATHTRRHEEAGEVDRLIGMPEPSFYLYEKFHGAVCIKCVLKLPCDMIVH